MRICIVDRCSGGSGQGSFCDEHRALWRESGGLQRALQVSSDDPMRRGRTNRAMVDFAMRIAAEELHGSK